MPNVACLNHRCQLDFQITNEREREREREREVGLGSDKEVRMKNYSSFHLEVQSVSCFFCVNITCELGYL